MGRIKDIDVELHELPDYEKGVQSEQERIIKLLKEKLAKMKFQEPNSDLEEHELLYDGLIALIKGEQA